MKKNNSWNIIKVQAIISISCYCYQYVKMEYSEGKELEYDQMKRVIIGLWMILSQICYYTSKAMLKVHLILFTHFWLCFCCTGFSLPVVGGGYSLVAVLAASLFVKHRHEGTSTSVVAAPGRQSTGSVVFTHRLSCSTSCGIFLQGLNPCLLGWQADSF